MYFKIETYGCQMNVADSEIITSILSSAGYTPTADIEQAQVIIFNTCSVREHAENRVLGRISNEISRKQRQPDLLIGVVGCMAQRLGEALLKANKQLDFVVGVDQYARLPQIIEGCRQENTFIASSDFITGEVYNGINPVRSDGLSAFVTIMRGCDNFCSYCIVPYTRGRERSRPMSEILHEVEQAVNEGHYEVTFLGQNVNSYSYEQSDFADLLKEATKIAGIRRIRFITSHPKNLSPKLIDTMATCEHICEHIHLPMQSGNNDILSKMNRNYTAEHYLSLITQLRQAIPNIAITTDVIVGFPSETEQQFADTLSLMSEIGFDFAYMYKYSTRSGTKAAELPDSINEEVKLDRLKRLIDFQTAITTAKYKKKIGEVLEVYVEGYSKRDQAEMCGKTQDFKMTVFPGDEGLVHRFVNVMVTDASGFTLKGEIIQ